jgi:hypothetical protein
MDARLIPFPVRVDDDDDRLLTPEPVDDLACASITAALSAGRRRRFHRQVASLVATIAAATVLHWTKRSRREPSNSRSWPDDRDRV